MAKRKKLSNERKADAVRLYAIWNRKKDDLGIRSQEQLAHLGGWKSQGIVSQYLLGTIPINLAAAIQFARVLEVELSDISPEFAAFLDKNQVTRIPMDDINADKIELTTKRKGGKPRFIRIRIYGKNTVDEEVAFMEVGEEDLPFRIEWLKSIKISEQNGLLVYCKDDSMEPFIFDGDVVIFDTDQTDIINNKTYAVESKAGVIIRKVEAQVSGALLLKSVNSNYRDQIVPQDMLLSGEVAVLGRMVGRSGAVAE